MNFIYKKVNEKHRVNSKSTLSKSACKTKESEGVHKNISKLTTIHPVSDHHTGNRDIK